MNHSGSAIFQLSAELLYFVTNQIFAVFRDEFVDVANSDGADFAASHVRPVFCAIRIEWFSDRIFGTAHGGYRYGFFDPRGWAWAR